MKLLRILDGLCFFLAPIAILFFLLAVLMLNVTFWEHRNFVRDLEVDGYVTQATVTHIYDDAELLVEFVDNREFERSEIIEVQYYDAQTLASITEGTTLDIRYLDYLVQPPVLDAHFQQVQAYRVPLGGLWTILLMSWLIIIVRPDWLYTGFVEDPTALLGFGSENA